MCKPTVFVTDIYRLGITQEGLVTRQYGLVYLHDTDVNVTVYGLDILHCTDLVCDTIYGPDFEQYTDVTRGVKF